tara:strand:- start:222 stop:1793 length:1572 start_codon:yes stop_codon:yes gene_type:complete
MIRRLRLNVSSLLKFLEGKILFLFEAIYSKLTILLAFHLFIVMLRILYVEYGPLEIDSEEAQYWIWSRHLQLSYYSKPPLIAYLNWFSTSLLGDTLLGIRINAILIGFGIAMTCYYLALELFHNRKTATIASLLSYALPFIWLPSSFFTTDSPLLLFWLLSLLFFWKAVKTDSMKNWIYFGISFGLGIISKYAILFLLPCLLLFLWLRHSQIFRNRKFYVGLGIGFLFFLPVVVWNLKNDFVSFRHLQHLTGTTEETVPIERIGLNLLEYIFGQIAILSPFFIVFYFKILKSWIRKQLSDEILFLILPGIIVFFVFLPIAFTRKSGINVNWPMFAYASIPVALAHWAVIKKKIGRLAVGAGVSLMFLLLISNLSVLDKVGIEKLIPVEFDPTKKLTGWQSLAQHVDSLKGRLPSTNHFVFSNSYHISSELQFYLEEQPTTYFLNYKNRMNQFSLWPGLEQFENKNYYGIFISTAPIKEELKESFEELRSFSTRKILYRGMETYNFKIYVLKDFKGIKEKNSHY